MTPKDATPLDVRLAQLAARQHGVVSVRQLLAFGFTRDQIRFRTATGRLHRLHRGVYAVGHTALPWQAPFVAAVLVAGEGAVLSHGSAAAWWAIRPRPSGNVHVTIPRNTGRDRHHRVTIHRGRALKPDEVTTRHGVAVTTVARTLLDDTGTAPSHLADRAVELAVSRQLVGAEVHDVMRAHPNARGIPTLRALLREHGDHGDWRQSDFEAYIIDICRTHGIPLPQTNVPLLGEVVDAYPSGSPTSRHSGTAAQWRSPSSARCADETYDSDLCSRAARDFLRAPLLRCSAPRLTALSIVDTSSRCSVAAVSASFAATAASRRRK